MTALPSILPSLVCLALVILGATTRLSAQTPHTPQPGSPERQARVIPSFSSTTPSHHQHASFVPSADGLLRSREANPGTTLPLGDAMRALVQAEYAEKTLPKPVVFKIDTLRVQRDFAHLECLPLFSDGPNTCPTSPVGALARVRQLPHVLANAPFPTPSPPTSCASFSTRPGEN